MNRIPSCYLLRIFRLFLLFGTSTWGIGDLQDDWQDFIEKVEASDLSGKKIALFGCGDSSSFSDSFCDGVGKIYQSVKDKAGKVGTEIINAEWKARTDWDFAFHAFDLRTNSGLAGNGAAGAVFIADAASQTPLQEIYDALTEAPEKKLRRRCPNKRTVLSQFDFRNAAFACHKSFRFFRNEKSRRGNDWCDCRFLNFGYAGGGRR